MAPRMRVMRGVARAFVLSTVLVVGATGAAVVVSQTAWFRQWLRGVIVQQSANYLNGTLSIGALEGNLFSGIALRDVSLTLDGQQLVAVRAVSLRYNLWQLATSDLTIDELVLEQPRLALRENEAGWTITQVIKQQAQEADREGPARPLTLDRIVVTEGEVGIEPLPDADRAVQIPRKVDAITLEASLTYAPVDIVANLKRLSLRTTTPDLEVRSLTGSIAVKDELVRVGQLVLLTDAGDLSVDGSVNEYLTDPQADLALHADRLPVPAVARFVPAMPPTDLQPTLDVSLKGPLSGATIKGSTRSSLGSIETSMVIDAVAPGRSASGSLSVANLDLSAAANRADLKSDITGDANIELHVGETPDPLDSLSGTVVANARVAVAGYTADRLDLTAQLSPRRANLDLRTFAYGARLTSKGQVRLPAGGAPIEYDLRGTARGVNARALPLPANAPRVPTNLNAAYHVRGSQPIGDDRRQVARVQASATFEDSRVPGVVIRKGSSVQANVRGSAVSYKADATVADLNLYEVGEAFGVAALRDQRYRSTIDAHLVAEGHGTELAALAVDANGEITEAQILGGSISGLQFTASLHDDAARLSANGAFAGFDPGELSGRAEAAGQISGQLSLEARLSNVSGGVTPDSVAGTARLSLDAPTVGGLTFNRAGLDADYENRTATIRELLIEGRDLNLNASGTLAIGDAGESSLQFRADSPSLSEIGRIVGQPLSGIARADGTVTGNRQALTIAGTVEGDGLKVEENGALTLRSQFTARVAELQWAAAAVQADSQATFVTIGGQNINELAAKTAYENQRVLFEVQAKQPQRQVDAGGAVTLHTDHQEIHLDRLTLEASGQRWEVPAGESATVQYGKDRIVVEGLRLVNNDQEIRVDGQIGSPDETLNASLTNVDLTAIDALLLRPPQFSGRLNAQATISGPTDALAAEGTFAVNGGGFRNFSYESLSGQVGYDGDGLTLDARLQQNATQWLTAKGYLPLTIFTAPPADSDGNEESIHDVPARPEDRVDLTIDSSPLGLGLLQGFTTALTGVDGTLEAHVRVTGSARDPHPEGEVTIANGKMTVEPTGVSYSNIAGKLELRPDRVHIDHIVALDNHQSSVSVTGDLAVHARELSGVQIWINAEDFKILDNRMGNVRVQSALEISGSLQAPSIAGDLGISSGRLVLDDILAAFGSSPYATKPTEYLSSPSTPLPETDAKPPDSPVAAAPAAVETERALAEKGPQKPVDDEPETSLLDGLKMNIRFWVPDDLIVRAESLQAPGGSISLGALNVTLGGDLTILKESRGSIRLTGEVNTIRGTYDFQGRRFEILRDGTVRFDGGETLDPVLNLRTRREIQAVEARVDVRGRLSQPEIVLSSTPPLEQADILALIVFNQPINQLGLGEQVSLAARAQALAAGVVAGQLAQSIGAALDLDTFEIEVGPESGATAQVTLGQQLGRALFLKVEQGIGEVSSTNVIVEYAFSRWLRLQTNLLQGPSLTQASMFRRQQGSGVDLIVLFQK